MERISAVNDTKEVVISFNKSFYPTMCVEKAVSDFSGSFIISLNQTENDLILRIKSKLGDVDMNNIGREFYNYVLYLIKRDEKIPCMVK